MSGTTFHARPKCVASLMGVEPVTFTVASDQSIELSQGRTFTAFHPGNLLNEGALQLELGGIHPYLRVQPYTQEDPIVLQGFSSEKLEEIHQWLMFAALDSLRTTFINVAREIHRLLFHNVSFQNISAAVELAKSAENLLPKIDYRDVSRYINDDIYELVMKVGHWSELDSMRFYKSMTHPLLPQRNDSFEDFLNAVNGA